MKLPSPIQAYFDADNRGDDLALAQAFAPDAIVEDEGHTHTGRQAIAAWWRDAKDKYQATLEPLEMHEMDGGARVRAMATGQFPGSPAILSFRFRLDGGLVSHLEIGA